MKYPKRYIKFKSHSIRCIPKWRVYDGRIENKITDRADDNGHVMFGPSDMKKMKRRFNNSGKLFNILLRLKQKIY